MELKERCPMGTPHVSTVFSSLKSMVDILNSDVTDGVF
jgi:hypothetical protein